MKFLTLLSFVSATILGLLSCGDGGRSLSPGFIGTPGPPSTPGFVSPTPTPQPAQDSFVYTANSGALTIGAAVMSGSTGAFASVFGAPFSDPSQPSAVAATPDGKVLFVANFQTNTVSGFDIGVDGSLTPLVPATAACSASASTGTQPVKIAVHPNGTLIYTANQGSNDITAIRFDTALTCLVPANGSPFAAGGVVRSVAIDRTGNLLFAVTDSGLNVFTIDDSTTGVLTSVSTGNFASGTLLNVTTSPVADLVYASDGGNGNQIFGATVNTTTGALTPVPGSPFPAGGQPAAMAIDPLGKFLYSANSTTNQIAGFNIGPSGALTQMAGSPFADANGPVDIAVDASAKFVVTANGGSGTIASFSIDATGALTPASTFAIGSGPASIALVKKP
jgi:DNA-binding beta-propeller fold protein YncE